MFITINDKPYNKFSIQSYHTKDIVEDGVTSYNIVYILVNGILIIESFDSDSARSSKLDDLAADDLFRTE